MKKISLKEIIVGLIVGISSMIAYFMWNIDVNTKQTMIDIAILQTKMDSVIEYKYLLDEIEGIAVNNDKRLSIIESKNLD